jgi:DNA-binding ferritin-like protein
MQELQAHTDRDPVEHQLCKQLTNLLALLRAQRWNYQTAHWQIHGDAFYGDHLLFQRLYEALDGEIDTLAEKVVGQLGRDDQGEYHFDNLTQSQQMDSWLSSWSIFTCAVRRCLQSEKDLQRVLKDTYEGLKKISALTLGLDDFLMAMASDHESHLYLLQQRLEEQGNKRQASQRLTRFWFQERIGKGVDRREQKPDYRLYVKRKKSLGEKPLARKEWQEWQDGDKPDKGESEYSGRGPGDKGVERGDVPEEKEPPKKKDPKKEDSKSDKESPKDEKGNLALGDPREFKPTSEQVKKLKTIFKGLGSKLKGELGRRTQKFLLDLGDVNFKRNVNKDLRKMKKKVREEMKEEAKAKALPDNPTEEQFNDFAKELFGDPKVKKQFADSFSQGVPEGVSKAMPQPFLAFALQHILDKMTEWAGKTEGSETAEDKDKRHKDYSKNFDKAKSEKDQLQLQIKELEKEGAPDDADLRKKWNADIKALQKQVKEKSRSMADLTQDYKLGPGEEGEAAKQKREKSRSQEKAQEDVAKKSRERVLSDRSTPEKRTTPDLKNMSPDQKRREQEKLKREDEELQTAYTRLEEGETGTPEEEEERKADLDRITKDRKSLGDILGKIDKSLKPLEDQQKKDEKAQADQRKKDLRKRKAPKKRKMIDLKNMKAEQMQKELEKLNTEDTKLLEEYNKLTEQEPKTDEEEEDREADLERITKERKNIENNVNQVAKALKGENKAKKAASQLEALWFGEVPQLPSTDRYNRVAGSKYATPQKRFAAGDLIDKFFDDLANAISDPDPEIVEKALQSMQEGEDEEGVEKTASSELERLWFASGRSVAGGAEKYFFDNPEKREVRQFQQSGALYNLTPEERAKGAPPTKTDIQKMPGGREFGTLTRYLVDTAEDVKNVPKGRDEIKKHPRLAGSDPFAGWTFAPRT